MTDIPEEGFWDPNGQEDQGTMQGLKARGAVEEGAGPAGAPFL